MIFRFAESPSYGDRFPNRNDITVTVLNVTEMPFLLGNRFLDLFIISNVHLDVFDLEKFLFSMNLWMDSLNYEKYTDFSEI